MEKEEKSQRRAETATTTATEFFLQWGNKKRLRCVRVRGSPAELSDPSNNINSNTTTTTTSRIRRKTFLNVKDSFFAQPSTRLTRNAETTSHRSEDGKSKSTSPERYYTTRGSMVGLDENGKNTVDGGAGNHNGGDEHNKNYKSKNNNNVNSGNKNINSSNNNSRGLVWPKIYTSLSSKEKEEDFMVMKGCKLPQRPKKRAKVIQRTLLLVSPGAWLTDMSLERYEVREKKSSKKRARGLKAMGNIESDSE